MKKIFIPALAVLLMFTVTGCFFPSVPDIIPPEEEPSTPPEEPPAGNEPPVAYIDAVAPPTITIGEDVTLQGHGIDTDGVIVAYRWRSNIDGPLGVNESVVTSALTVGEHIIYLKVQDNNGDWSEEVSDTVVVAPEVIVPPEIVSFEADSEMIHFGETVTLSWEVTGADEITIEPDIGLVDASDTVDVTPEETTDYVITATMDSITRHAVVQITVLPNSYAETMVPVASETSSIFDGSPAFLWPPGMGISIGDTATDLSYQGFVSFDISGIPDDAVITVVEVDFSSYATGGTPFADLGCLRVYPQNYGTLEVNDFFTGSPSGHILRYCSEATIVSHESGSFRDALQDAVGHDRFQVRFQFNEMESDGNGDQEYIHWDNEELIIHIEYDSFQ